MANMSYCRFQNTVRDLQDCLDAMEDMQISSEKLSPEEERAKADLINLCREIIELSEEE